MSNVSMINGHIDNVLSDEQIVKALEKYADWCFNCDNGCACSDTRLDCPNNVVRFAFDLINRLKADKEVLINGQETLMKCIAKKKETIAELDAEVERLHKEGLQLNRIFMDFVNMKKAEAIKKFAERLRKQATVDDDSTWWIANIDVDNLVKEMTESDSNSKAFWEDTN